MGGRESAAYYREWRAKHPEYRERQAALRRKRRAVMTPEQRRLDRGLPKPSPKPEEPLQPLMPFLQNGSALSFWNDELRLDLAQEMFLALLEGRSVAEAVEDYYGRETSWLVVTCPLLIPDEND